MRCVLLTVEDGIDIRRRGRSYRKGQKGRKGHEEQEKPDLLSLVSLGSFTSFGSFAASVPDPGEPHLDPGPAVRPVPRGDRAAVAFGDGLDDGEAQAGVAVARLGLLGAPGEETVEDPLPVLLRNARPTV